MDEILLMQNFCLISGLSADEAEQWEPLVLACWEELKGKLRAGVDVKNHEQRLALACAALANHRFQSIQGTVCASVKVGDLSFTQRSLSERSGDMSCQVIAKRLIYQCGRKVYFPYEQGEKCFTAYLNPIRERTEKIVPTESGVLHQGKWLMLAAAQDADLVQNGVIFRAGEDRFIVERAEKVFFGEETAYFWAIVQKAEGVE